MTKMNRIKSIAGLIRPYVGKWVTISSDKTRVMGVSNRMESALSQAHKKGECRPLLLKV